MCDTVVTDTPASFATSLIDTRFIRPYPLLTRPISQYIAYILSLNRVAE